MVHQSMYRLTGKHVTNLAFYVIFAFLTYFIWCDIGFYSRLAEERTQILTSNQTNVVSKFSVKLRMLTHLDQYVYLPLCRWLNIHLGISKLPWMSPNLVTFMHFTIAVCCGRFFGSSHLLFRRIACILFEVRSCLDILDGVIYRAQRGSTTFVSGWGSMGYWIDGMADVFGSLFIILGTIYRYNKCPPLKNSNKINKYKGKGKEATDVESAAKLLSSDVGSSEESTGELPGVERHSRAYAIGICLFVTVTVVLRSKLWDHFQQSYHGLLGVPRTDISSRKQLEILNYPSTWLCQWLWRFHSADAFLSFSLCAIFFDKLWRWMRFSVYAAVPNLLIFGGICQLHVMYVKSFLSA